MKYRLGGTITCTLFPISSFSTWCVRVCTKESDSYIHCVNGLGQNTDCYVKRQGVDSLIGAHSNSHLSVLQNECTSVAGFYTSEGSYYLILYTRSSVRPFQFHVCATPPTVSIGIRSIWNLPQWYPVVSAPGHFYTQSGRHFLVVSTYILVNSTHKFFFAKNGCFNPVHFPRPEYWAKKICVFVCTVCCKYFNIIIFFFAIYSEKYLFAEVYVYFFCSTIADTLSSWYIQRWNCICGYW